MTFEKFTGTRPVGDVDLAAMYAGARTLRLGDGPDEVHRNHIGKLELRAHA